MENKTSNIKKILFVADPSEKLYDEISAAIMLLKPDLALSNIDVDGLVTSKIPNDLSTQLIIVNKPYYNMYGDNVGSHDTLNRIIADNIKICLSGGYIDALETNHRWYFNFNNCLCFHPGQSGYSLSFIYFHMDLVEFQVIHAHHSHMMHKHYKRFIIDADRDILL